MLIFMNLLEEPSFQKMASNILVFDTLPVAALELYLPMKDQKGAKKNEALL